MWPVDYRRTAEQRMEKAIKIVIGGCLALCIGSLITILWILVQAGRLLTRLI